MSKDPFLGAPKIIVRRAVFAFTKPSAGNPRLFGLSVSTTFREVVPLVPVFDSVESNQAIPGVSVPSRQGTILTRSGVTSVRRATWVSRSVIECLPTTRHGI